MIDDYNYSGCTVLILILILIFIFNLLIFINHTSIIIHRPSSIFHHSPQSATFHPNRPAGTFLLLLLIRLDFWFVVFLVSGFCIILPKSSIFHFQFSLSLSLSLPLSSLSFSPPPSLPCTPPTPVRQPSFILLSRSIDNSETYRFITTYSSRLRSI